MRDFLPQGQVTGIGSLPHHNPEDAVRFVAENSPMIPFWPQLPQRSDDEMMLPQMLTPLQKIMQRHSTARFDIPVDQLNDFRRQLREVNAILDETSAAGFYAFERACQSKVFVQATALKGQITGPITLAHCLFVDGKPLAMLPEVLSEFTDYLRRLGVWQIQRLRQFNKSVLLFIDEPALTLGTHSPPSLASLQTLVGSLRSAGAYVGIHCCASDLPDLICRVKPDIISFDAHQGLEVFLSNNEVRTFVDAGGWLALGMVPTWNDLSQFDVMQAFLRLISTHEKAHHLSRLTSQALITSTCGLGLVPVSSAVAAFTACNHLAHLMQQTVTSISKRTSD
jgi:hypothetical protein